MSIDIEAIKARLTELPSPGPWVALEQQWTNNGHTWSAYGIEQDPAVYGNDEASAIIYAQKIGGLTKRPAEFIAHAPADIAALLVALAAAERARGEAREESLNWRNQAIEDIDKARQDVQSVRVFAESLQSERDAARAEAAALREEVARLRAVAEALQPLINYYDKLELCDIEERLWRPVDDALDALEEGRHVE